MSEKNPVYQVNRPVQTLAEFAKLPCCLDEYHPDYQPPTAAEIRLFKVLTGWSQNDIAKIAGVSFNPKKGSSTVRKWTSEDTGEDQRNIESVRWRMMLLCAGVIDVDDQLALINRESDGYWFEFIQDNEVLAKVAAGNLAAAEGKAGLPRSRYDHARVSYKIEGEE